MSRTNIKYQKLTDELENALVIFTADPPVYGMTAESIAKPQSDVGTWNVLFDVYKKPTSTSADVANTADGFKIIDKNGSKSKLKLRAMHPVWG